MQKVNSNLAFHLWKLQLISKKEDVSHVYRRLIACWAENDNKIIKINFYGNDWVRWPKWKEQQSSKCLNIRKLGAFQISISFATFSNLLSLSTGWNIWVIGLSLLDMLANSRTTSTKQKHKTSKEIVHNPR